MFLVRFTIMALAFWLSVPIYAANIDLSACEKIKSQKSYLRCHVKLRVQLSGDTKWEKSLISLSDNAKWDAISVFDGERIREETALELGIAANSSWEDIIEEREESESEIEQKEAEAKQAAEQKVHMEKMAAWTEQVRQERAKELGAASDAPWSEIERLASEESRRAYARENGMKEHSSWEAIQKEAFGRIVASWKARGINITPPKATPEAKKKAPVKHKPKRKK